MSCIICKEIRIVLQLRKFLSTPAYEFAIRQRWPLARKSEDCSDDRNDQKHASSSKVFSREKLRFGGASATESSRLTFGVAGSNPVAHPKFPQSALVFE